MSYAPIERQQVAAAFSLAFLFHLAFGFCLHSRPDTLPSFPELAVIDVKLLPAFKNEIETEIVLPPQLPAQEIVSPAIEIPPQTEVPEQAEPKSVPETVPTLPAVVNPPPIINNEAGSAAGRFPAEINDKDYVPSQWALEPPLRTERLKSMGLLQDVDCLRALSEDCAALRKEVFAEFELTEMEKVWTETRADTGMPAAFYGMSEREIRLKIGSKIAGENGFMLLPGIGIDGSLWDMMHGVKQTCKMKRGIDSSGKYGVVMVCPESLSAARDKKYYIPPKE